MRGRSTAKDRHGGRTAGRFGALAAVLAALAVAAASPDPMAAQDEMAASLELVGGAFQYDLSGTGTVAFGGLRLPLPLHRWIVAEPGLTYSKYESQADDEIPLLIPEVQVQARLPRGRLEPFLGLGLGGVFDMRKARETAELVVSSYSVGAGARARLGGGWTARGELRVRAIDGFTGSSAEWTVGVGRAF